MAFKYLQIVNCFFLDKKYPFQLSPFVNTSLIRLFSNYLSHIKLLEYVHLTISYFICTHLISSAIQLTQAELKIIHCVYIITHKCL